MEKYVKLILSMSTDYLMGCITNETYLANLEMIVKLMKFMKEEKKDDK